MEWNLSWRVVSFAPAGYRSTISRFQLVVWSLYWPSKSKIYALRNKLHIQWKYSSFFPCVHKVEVVKKTTHEFELIVEVIVIYCPLVPNIPPPWRCGPTRAMASSFLRFLDHTKQCITAGRTSLGEGSGRRRDLYLSTHKIKHRQTSMLRRDSNPQSQQTSGRRPTP